MVLSILTPINKPSDQFNELCLVMTELLSKPHNFRWIVGINNATDEDKEAIKEDLSYVSDEVSIAEISDKDISLGEVRNHLIKKCTTPYFMLLDSDDLVTAALPVFANDLDKSDPDILLPTSYLYRQSDGTTLVDRCIELDGKYIEQVCTGKIFQYMWGIAFKTRWFKDNKIKFSNCMVFEDLVPFMKSLSAGNIMTSNRIIYLHRKLRDSISHTVSENTYKGLEVAINDMKDMGIDKDLIVQKVENLIEYIKRSPGADAERLIKIKENI